ncbi:ApbA_C-domain-containing protein [Chaetoceros tenuissimus]|uniref:ApbA_C-domain-containing protein n=1 Tax=Chaetoceros tenuissimus TaxID=426638 RepID=A0AAD3HCQ2_9STRA|nr:ApbA_C-domain-containing protein [Chaetoceros tenuissimus]
MKELKIFLLLVFSAWVPSSSFTISNQFNSRTKSSSRSIQATTQQEVDATTATSASKPSIAIIGSGAVGCYYGARLYETNQYNVKFFMRNEHYTASTTNGLNVTSIHGDVFIPPEKLMAYDDIEEMGKTDWVILCLKSTGIDCVPELVVPLLKEDKSTRVLVIMNGLVDEDVIRLIEGYQEDEKDLKLTKCTVYGGMALLCSNRIRPGHIDHSYAGKLTASLAKANDENNEDNHRDAMLNLWKPTQGFEFVYDDNLVRARWSKNLWNLPFNGISVAMNGITVDQIVNDPGLRKLAYRVMDETLAVANTDLSVRGFSEKEYLGEVERAAMMQLSDDMGPYKTSTMLDLVNRRKMEVKYVFRKAVDRANELGVEVPTLDTLVTQIEFLQRKYNL